MKTTLLLRLALLLPLLAAPAPAPAQGPLLPPGAATAPEADRALDGSGAPVPSMKTLTQTDPGQPIPSRDADQPELNGTFLYYQITQPGHYYLTENITKRILIQSDHVTLDLRGFRVNFLAVGGGAPGTQVAIDAVNGTVTHENVSVRNGHISGEWLHGVRLGKGAKVAQLQVTDCREYGIRCGAVSTVEHCTVRLAPPLQGSPVAPVGNWAGIHCDDGAIIRNCMADGIRAIGISALQSARIVDCVSVNNYGCGIVAHASSSLSGCIASDNKATGIDVNTQNTLLNCTAKGNLGEGFLLRGGCALTNCAARANQKEGFYAKRDSISGQQTPLEENVAVNFHQCVAQKNSWDGFHAEFDCQFTHCTADKNGTAENPNPMGTSHGFHLSNGSTVLHCTATNNVASGFRGQTNNRIEGCTAHSNGGYGVDVFNDQNVVIRNFLRNNTAGHITVLPGGGVAPVQSAGTANALSNLSF